jgi:hypothetical protein
MYSADIFRQSLNLIMADDSLVVQQQRVRLIHIAASAVTSFYLYCVCIIMAGNTSLAATTTSQWADNEVEAILQHFISKKSEIGDAGNFKKKTYMAAAEAIGGHTRTW